MNQTETAQRAASGEERLRDLERDRWPEFERELYRRRLRRIRFTLSEYRLEERPRWSWMVPRCRTWEEVERVLNRHRVQWKREGGNLALDGACIHRCG